MCQCPPLLVVPSIRRPARHELCPCYVRPIAAGTNETSLCYVLWESSGLKALLWGAKAPVVASIATVSQCHRHCYLEALNESSGLLLLYMLLIPLIN